MSLNKKQMVREIGRRTRLSNQNVQAVIEALIDLWSDELAGGGRIELENFIVLEALTRRRVHPRSKSPYSVVRLTVRAGKGLRAALNQKAGIE